MHTEFEWCFFTYIKVGDKRYYADSDLRRSAPRNNWDSPNQLSKHFNLWTQEGRIYNVCGNAKPEKAYLKVEKPQGKMIRGTGWFFPYTNGGQQKLVIPKSEPIWYEEFSQTEEYHKMAEVATDYWVGNINHVKNLREDLRKGTVLRILRAYLTDEVIDRSGL